MGVFSTPGFVILYITCVSSLIYSDTCVKTGPCSCEFSNGTGIDLSPAVPSKYYTVDTYAIKANGTKYELSTFFYHPCFDSTMNLTLATDDKDNTCGGYLSICRNENIMNLTNATTHTFTLEKERFEFLGSTNDSIFSDQGNSITYPNGPSKTIVLLECTQAINSLHVYSLVDPNELVLAFYSPDACLKVMGGRSLGSTLCIIFFSMLVFYLVLGICAKKFLMGATGIEVIPNLAFWSLLPGLVKDGWLFMTSGFKLPARSAAGPTISPDPNSYDSI